MVTVVCEQNSGLSWFFATLTPERSEVCNERLALIDRNERVVQPTPFQDVGERQAIERAGCHLVGRDRFFLLAISVVLGDWPDGTMSSAGGRTTRESPSCLASKPKGRIVVV
jgi:hypothetical protein